jgi:hypothetical protein
VNIIQSEQQETNWLTCNNEDASDFLYKWRRYVHDIDDIIDGDKTGSEFIIATFMSAAYLYAHPFYLANLAALQQIVVNCTNAYADSVAWEKSDTPWKREFSDHYRHFGMEMAIAVAAICGGYNHAREVSLTLREICYHGHHNEKGEMI